MVLTSRATHVLQWPVQRVASSDEQSQSPKAGLSADWSLQLASMKLESLVIVDQLRHGEYVPGPCTHRPSRHGSCERPKSVSEPARDQAAEGERSDWGEVVTR